MFDTPTQDAAVTGRGPDLEQRFKRRFGRESWLRGGSDNLRDLIEFLESAARVDLPVLLFGARGCGRGDAARWLHLLGSKGGRFVRFDASVTSGAELAAELRAAAAEAEAGTLYLSAVDRAEPAVQFRLADLLNQGLAHLARSGGLDLDAPPRLVASAAEPSKLHPDLRAELEFLSFTIEPLAARTADVEALARHFLRAYGGSRAGLSPDAAAALAAYSWPGNIPELRRLMARVASFQNGKPIDLETLRAHAPQAVAAAVDPAQAQLEEIVRDCVVDRKRIEAERMLHPALRRALSHVARHLSDPIRLKDLAKAAYVSPSHLSHLSKAHLGISPMALVTRVRLERAKQLLRREPGTKITEIAARSGFGDLRHFERMFKKSTGVAPRFYRLRESGQGTTMRVVKSAG